MDFVYLFRVLLKRKWIILGATIIAVAIAYWFTKDDPRLYRSTAQVSTGFTVNDAINVNGDNNVDLYAADTKFNNAIVTFTSPTVSSLISYKLILHDLQDPNPFRELDEKDKNSELYKEISKDEAIRIFQNKLDSMTMLTSYKPDEKKLLQLLDLYGYDYNSVSENLSVYRLERTDYIQIDSYTENPELSAFEVNTAFQEFLRYYKTIRTEKSQESIDTLRSLLEKKKQDMDAKNAIMESHGLTNTDIAAKSNYELINSLETTLANEKDKQTTLYYSQQKINSRLSAAGNDTNVTNTSTINNDDIILLKNQMNAANDAYLKSGSTDQTLLNKYNQLKKQYQNKVINIGETVGGKTSGANISDLLNQKSDIEVDLEAEKTKIASLQTQINSLKGNVQSDASQSATDQTLQSEAEQAGKEYLAAQQNYNDALDINYSSVNNFRQILFGQPAIDPEPSKRVKIVGIAGMSALVFSILTIIFLVYLDSSVKTPSIFAKSVNLKLISMVNLMNLKNKNLAEIVTDINKHQSPENPHDYNRQNVFRESLRKLRYEIEKSGKKIFLFTSTKKGEGKTTLIQALSYSMSLSKKKILIIDTNFCNNDLTVQLHVESLLEKIDPNEKTLLSDIKNMVTDIGAGSVYVIGCEGGDYTPSEILPRENLLKHLHTLTQEYDYIFLEGPPLNDFSDSKELAEYVDGVIAVFSATRNIKQIDKESIAFFKGLNGKFCGSILNKVNLENVNVS